MRLINTKTLELELFKADNIPDYAIISHTWGKEEVTFQEYTEIHLNLSNSTLTNAGYSKVLSACAYAALQDDRYVWIDTCCIDKRDLAELNESLNSMCQWYNKSKVCYAYLEDFGDKDFRPETFFKSRWWTRGWTLQELIAPDDVIFLNKFWQTVARKGEIVDMIHKRTRIQRHALLSLASARQFSVAQRMSWASDRSTTRLEDRAYSLMGLFNIHMPLLYGEGENAFIRLQEEISKRTADHSIFAWGFQDKERVSMQNLKTRVPESGYLDITDWLFSHPTDLIPVPVFAKSPKQFRNSGLITPIVPPDGEFAITNQGVRISLEMEEKFGTNDNNSSKVSVALLRCEGNKGQLVGILLWCFGENKRNAFRLGGTRQTDDDLPDSTFLFSLGQVMEREATEVFIQTKDNIERFMVNSGQTFKIVIKIDEKLLNEGWQVGGTRGSGCREEFRTCNNSALIGELDPGEIIAHIDDSYRLCNFAFDIKSSDGVGILDVDITLKEPAHKTASCTITRSGSLTYLSNRTDSRGRIIEHDAVTVSPPEHEVGYILIDYGYIDDTGQLSLKTSLLEVKIGFDTISVYHCLMISISKSQNEDEDTHM